MKKIVRTNYKRKRNFDPKSFKKIKKEDVFESRMASILQTTPKNIKGIFSQRARTTIRLNPLKKNTYDTYKRLKSYGYELREIPWSKDTYYVDNVDKSEISKTEEYEKGYFYIQDLSSILATVVLNPKPNEKILDMCAAPGSKTTHIASLTENKADITANDIEVSRMNSLRNVIEQFGVQNITFTKREGQYFGKEEPVTYDKVILDAPCSGEGRIFLNGEKPLRFWSTKKVKIYSIIQKELIESAFRTLKHGGEMIYSTCTLEPQENEGIVTWLLNKYPNSKLKEIDIIKDENFKRFKKYTEPGISHWSNNDYHKDITKSIRVIPSSDMMGFYIAKIQKI